MNPSSALRTPSACAAARPEAPRLEPAAAAAAQGPIIPPAPEPAAPKPYPQPDTPDPPIPPMPPPVIPPPQSPVPM